MATLQLKLAASGLSGSINSWTPYENRSSAELTESELLSFFSTTLYEPLQFTALKVKKVHTKNCFYDQNPKLALSEDNAEQLFKNCSCELFKSYVLAMETLSSRIRMMSQFVTHTIWMFEDVKRLYKNASVWKTLPGQRLLAGAQSHLDLIFAAFIDHIEDTYFGEGCEFWAGTIPLVAQTCMSYLRGELLCLTEDIETLETMHLDQALETASHAGYPKGFQYGSTEDSIQAHQQLQLWSCVTPREAFIQLLLLHFEEAEELRDDSTLAVRILSALAFRDAEFLSFDRKQVEEQAISKKPRRVPQTNVEDIATEPISTQSHVFILNTLQNANTVPDFSRAPGAPHCISMCGDCRTCGATLAEYGEFNELNVWAVKVRDSRMMPMTLQHMHHALLLAKPIIEQAERLAKEHFAEAMEIASSGDTKSLKRDRFKYGIDLVAERFPGEHAFQNHQQETWLSVDGTSMRHKDPCWRCRVHVKTRLTLGLSSNAASYADNDNEKHGSRGRPHGRCSECMLHQGCSLAKLLVARTALATVVLDENTERPLEKGKEKDVIMQPATILEVDIEAEGHGQGRLPQILEVSEPEQLDVSTSASTTMARPGGISESVTAQIKALSLGHHSEGEKLPQLSFPEDPKAGLIPSLEIEQRTPSPQKRWQRTFTSKAPSTSAGSHGIPATGQAGREGRTAAPSTQPRAQISPVRRPPVSSTRPVRQTLAEGTGTVRRRQNDTQQVRVSGRLSRPTGILYITHHSDGTTRNYTRNDVEAFSITASGATAVQKADQQQILQAIDRYEEIYQKGVTVRGRH